MTIGKATALTAAFIGVFALGVAVGPSMTHRVSDRETQTTVQPTETATATQPAPAATPARAKAPSAKATSPTRKATAPASAKSNAVASSLPASDPRLHDRLRPVLNRGARMDVAADGFRNAEEFATVAHAAHNTNVPFMVLKHRVVSEHQSVAEALRDVKPDIDAKAEAARAAAAAKSDVAAVVG